MNDETETNQGKDNDQAQAKKPDIMDEGVRQELLAKSHINGGPKEYATESGDRIELRRFSLMTMELCELMPLPMMMEGVDGLNNQELIDQVTAFAWMQSEPLEMVCSHIDAGTWKTPVRMFKAKLDIPVISQLLDDVGVQAKQAAASAFELKKKAQKRTK
jgi:hypothetical protein